MRRSNSLSCKGIILVKRSYGPVCVSFEHYGKQANREDKNEHGHINPIQSAPKPTPRNNQESSSSTGPRACLISQVSSS
jgi:hypothetical protein